jgi:hypothetical protein
MTDNTIVPISLLKSQEDIPLPQGPSLTQLRYSYERNGPATWPCRKCSRPMPHVWTGTFCDDYYSCYNCKITYDAYSNIWTDGIYG